MFIVPLLLISLFSLSCSNDDGGDSNVDVIVGSWKITNIVINGTDIYPLLVAEGVCEIRNVTHFNNNFSVMMNTFQENAETGNCEPGPDSAGTWSREGNVYTINLDGSPESVTPVFSDNNNKFTVSQEFEGQLATVTFTRQ